MGEDRCQQALLVAAVFHGVLASAWFVLGVLVPGAASLRDGLLLVPMFVAAGVLTLTAGRHLNDEVWRHLAWTAAFLDLIGLAPLALYMARLVLARDAPLATDTRWAPSGINVTIAALTLLALTALTQLFTVGVALRYVYAARRPRPV